MIKTGGVFVKRVLGIMLAAISLLLLLLPARASGEEAVSSRDILVYAKVKDGMNVSTGDGTGTGQGGQSGSNPANPKTDPSNPETDPSNPKTDPGKNVGSSDSGDTLYSVELTWGSMTFDYTRNSAEPWSVPEGTDENGLAANEIQVKNLSGGAILYRTSFAPSNAQYPLSGILTARKFNDEAVPCQNDYVYLANPDEGDNKLYKRHIDHVFLSISGTLPSSLSSGTHQVGKVTVEIMPYSDG